MGKDGAAELLRIEPILSASFEKSLEKYGDRLDESERAALRSVPNNDDVVL